MWIENIKGDNYKFCKYYIDNETGKKEIVTTISSKNDLLAHERAQKILLSKIIQKKKY